MATHATFGGSNCARWMTCPASIRLSEGAENVESAAAREGTLAHELAAFWLSTGNPPVFPSDEMRHYVEEYVEFCEAVEGGSYTELAVNFGPSFPDMFGTLDRATWNYRTRTLTVIDFKFGAGVFVSAEDNKQLKFYALAAMRTLAVNPETIRAVIYQPRCGDEPVREETFSIIDLLEFEVDLFEAYERAKDPNAPAVMSDNCKFCPALVDCPAHIAAALEAFEDETGASESGKALAEKLEMVEPLTRWIKAVEDKAYNDAMAGEEIPGFKLVEKRATRKWRDEGEVIADLVARFGYLETMNVKTPAQIEKIAGKEFVDALCVKESSGLTLVRMADKRPAVRPLESMAAQLPIEG